MFIAKRADNLFYSKGSRERISKNESAIVDDHPAVHMEWHVTRIREQGAVLEATLKIAEEAFMLTRFEVTYNIFGYDSSVG